MINIVQSVHNRLVREEADRYIRQGYSVQIQPTDAELPAFLHGFQPDMIVTTPEGKIVVEVKTRENVRPSGYWEELTRAVEKQTGWRFRLVLDNRREEELVGAEQPVISREQIDEQLLAARMLADLGILGGALLLTWATIEAVLREASRAQGLQLPNQGPGPLITALYTEGNLEREDYETLRRTLQARNQAVHGFQVENIDRSLIDQVQTIAKRLLDKASD